MFFVDDDPAPHYYFGKTKTEHPPDVESLMTVQNQTQRPSSEGGFFILHFSFIEVSSHLARMCQRWNELTRHGFPNETFSVRVSHFSICTFAIGSSVCHWSSPGRRHLRFICRGLLFLLPRQCTLVFCPVIRHRRDTHNRPIHGTHVSPCVFWHPWGRGARNFRPHRQCP